MYKAVDPNMLRSYPQWINVANASFLHMLKIESSDDLVAAIILFSFFDSMFLENNSRWSHAIRDTRTIKSSFSTFQWPR